MNGTWDLPTTTEHVPTLLELAQSMPHDNILGIIGGADQLFAFYLLDPSPSEIVGFDNDLYQILLAMVKKSLIQELSFEDYVSFGTHAMNADARKKLLAHVMNILASDTMFGTMSSQLEGLIDGIIDAKFVQGNRYAGRTMQRDIVWHVDKEKYKSLQANIGRILLLPGDLHNDSLTLSEWQFSAGAELPGIPKGHFNLAYLSNALREEYPSGRQGFYEGKDLSGRANAILERIDRYLVPNGNHLLCMEIIGKKSGQVEGEYAKCLQMTEESDMRIHHSGWNINGPVNHSFIYSLSPRGARIASYNTYGAFSTLDAARILMRGLLRV